jgi:hypothetical protein
MLEERKPPLDTKTYFRQYISRQTKTWITLKKNKLRGLSPQANYTDRATAACRRS